MEHATTGGQTTAYPDENDVVVRRKGGNPSILYLLGTPAAPDQFSVRTRDEAVSRAVAYATHQHVRAWMVKTDENFVLLGSFREALVGPSGASDRSAPAATAPKKAPLVGAPVPIRPPPAPERMRSRDVPRRA